MGIVRNYLFLTNTYTKEDTTSLSVLSWRKGLG